MALVVGEIDKYGDGVDSEGSIDEYGDDIDISGSVLVMIVWY